jgi:hypothetical protein
VDRAILAEHLALAERHVAQGEEHLARQRRLISGEACGGLSRRTRAIDHLLYENLSMQRISPRRFPPPWSVRQVTREAEEGWGRH